LPEPYISYFILGEWNLNEELLYIHFEREQKLELVKKQSFKINKRSKKESLISYDIQPIVIKGKGKNLTWVLT